MIKRIFSSLILIALFICSVFVYRPLFDIMLILAGFIMLWEWYNMTKNSIIYIALGLIIIPVPMISLYIISNLDSAGWLLLTYISIIATCDTMAMFGGKLIEGVKLAPRLSPQKTVSGLLSGVISAGIVAYLLQFIPIYNISIFIPNSLYITIIAMILAFVGQMSDLFISFFKRRFKIKDSGTIIPGHGGTLDRFDSIILTSPLTLLFILYIS